jgi:hypothetical protein
MPHFVKFNCWIIKDAGFYSPENDVKNETIPMYGNQALFALSLLLFIFQDTIH